MGREGRRIVTEEFSLEIVIRRTLELYDQRFDESTVAAAGASASATRRGERGTGGNANPPKEPE
jgi:hypothetical protein